MIMKTKKTLLVTTATLGAMMLFSACSRDNSAETTAATTPPTTESSIADSMNTATNAMAESWSDLKDYSYEQRSEFAAKANAYAATLDQRIQVAGGEASEELAEARDELRAAANEVSNATAETWDATKERVAEAWNKAQMAYRPAE